MMRWFIRYVLVLGVPAIVVPAFLLFYLSSTPLRLAGEAGPAPGESVRTPARDRGESGAGTGAGAGGREGPSAAVVEHNIGSAVDKTAAGSGQDVVVWGRLETVLGRVVPKQEIRLESRSARKRYVVTSGPQGDFLIEKVAPAGDYEIEVTPRGMYRSYQRRDVVLASAEENLEIVLEPLRTGVLRGRVVDTQGQPVPGFLLSVRSLSKNIGVQTAVTDSVGVFEIMDFPEGGVEIFSREISLLARGLSFDPDDTGLLRVLVDHGPHALSGRVLDPSGQAAVGATVLLSWDHSRGGIRTTVKRLALTGPGGYFRIGSLGAVEHRLEVSYKYRFVARRDVSVGGDNPELVVHLQAQ